MRKNKKIKRKKRNNKGFKDFLEKRKKAYAAFSVVFFFLLSIYQITLGEVRVNDHIGSVTNQEETIFVNENPDFKIEFGEKNPQVRFIAKEEWDRIDFSIKPIYQLRGLEIEQEEEPEWELIKEEGRDSVIYREVLPETDLKYSIIEGKGIKEVIEIRRKKYVQDEYRFDFKMDAGIKVEKRNENGKEVWYFLNESGKEFAYIPSPYVMDSANSVNRDVRVEIEKGEMILRLNEEWLKSSDRVYPIFIDPTLIIQPVEEGINILPQTMKGSENETQTATETIAATQDATNTISSTKTETRTQTATATSTITLTSTSTVTETEVASATPEITTTTEADPVQGLFYTATITASPTLSYTPSFTPTTAYSYGWTKTLENNNLYDTAYDDVGNVYAVSRLSSTYYIDKFQNNGASVWTMSLPNGSRDIVITIGSNGVLYIAGRFSGTVDFDPTGAVDSHSSNGSYDNFISKYDVDGNYYWTRTFGGSSVDETNGITTNQNNEVFVTGNFWGSNIDFDGTDSGTDIHSSHGGYDVFITKYNGDGTYGWTRTFGSGGYNSDRGYSVKSDDTNGIYVYGYFYGSFDFNDSGVGDPDVHTSNGSTDFFLTKHLSDGTYVWTRTFGGEDGDDLDEGHDNFVLDGDGGIYMTSYFYSRSIDFDGTDGEDIQTLSLSDPWGYNDVFLTKYYTDGSYGWTRIIGGSDTEYGIGVAVDNDNNVYVGGTTYSSGVVFDDGRDILMNPVYDDTSIFFAQYSSDGNYNWSRVFPFGSYLASIDMHNDKLFIGGWFWTPGTMNFNIFDVAGEEDIHDSGEIFLSQYNLPEEISKVGQYKGNTGYISMDADVRVLGPNGGGRWLSGDNTLVVGDINADGYNDIIVESYVSGIYIMFGQSDEMSGIYDFSIAEDYNVRLTGCANYIGYASITTGDVNGDSKDDLIFGCTTGKKVYILFSTLLDDITGTGNVFDLSQPTSYNIRYDGINTELYDDNQSKRGIRVEDIHGDGNDDLILIDDGIDSWCLSEGYVYIMLSSLIDDVGETTGNIMALSDTSSFNIRYGDGGCLTGVGAFDTGDFSGDGKIDLLMGNSSANTAWLVYSSLLASMGETIGNTVNITDSSNYNVKLNEVSVQDDIATWGSHDIGDVNGDSFGDLVVGAVGADFNGSNSGSVYVLFSTFLDVIIIIVIVILTPQPDQ